MEFLSSNKTIIAISSGGVTNSAIGLIRISGFEDITVFKKNFSINLDKIKERYAYTTSLLFDNQVIDEIVLTFFKGPKSYTGENILELAVHGNVLNMNRIVDKFLEYDFISHAKPGEFSYRALKNKKLNLSQIEGLDLFLNANSGYALNQGFSLLNGKLKQSFHELYESFLNHRSSVELAIDFSDDVGEEQAQIEINKTFKIFFNKVNELYLRTHKNLEGLINPEIVLIGKPNAGKSSFFNALLRENRAIVNKMAGTTRDYISEKLILGNIAFSLIDTAGLRITQDEIEKSGIERTNQMASQAFIKVLMINPFDFDQNDVDILETKNVDLIVFSHQDLPQFSQKKDKCLELLQKNSFFGPIGPKKSGPIEPSGPVGPEVFDVVLSDQKEPDLAKIEECFTQKFENLASSEPILVNRQRESIKNVYLNTQSYHKTIQSTQDIGIIGSELNILGHCLSELLGIVSTDDVLKNIFSNFCIGK